MFKISPQAASYLYDVDLIAFGSGHIGKKVIPYLAQDPNIRLHGVTNSRVAVNDDGTFLDTGLPIRSLSAWVNLFPHAAILVTADAKEEIVRVCREVGFEKFKFLTPEIISKLTEVEAQAAEAKASDIFESLCLSNELHDAHRAAFSEFRECNRGKTVAVVGTGPSLNYYTQIPQAPHIGVNASFLKEDLTLDYYFITHYIPEWCEKLKDYNFVKFFDINRNYNSKDQFPEYIVEENGGRRCFSISHVPSTQLHTNIECYPLMGYGSIIFRAIHFALYTHPQRLLLVGCDCTASGHCDNPLGDVLAFADQHVLEWLGGYRRVKKFAALHYPDMEIISVNPVGLKGMFHDMYTESYLDAHPEIDRERCEVLDQSKYKK